ncbi:hypothetical protein KIH41_17420 [Litoribacter ruber]|uniref:hypothetical protein n=1 Tax=Litoribacter ruber TaxID=702568 RepID=UPI001BDA97FD|nr:hypothetical protein [Litoribacter ruber]MBT0813072.1 hypothetical protein [Litoribacter ruber]
MRIEYKFIISGFILLIIIGVFFIYKVSKNSIGNKHQHMMEMYGSIEFSGSIIKIHEISRWGRIYAIACIDLDDSNIDNFYHFDKNSAFKLKNGIATLPLGFIGDSNDELVTHILKSSYVEVNVKNSGEIRFFDQNGVVKSTELWFRSNNLIESDLNRCY